MREIFHCKGIANLFKESQTKTRANKHVTVRRLNPVKQLR